MTTTPNIPTVQEFRAALHDMIANGGEPAPKDWTADRLQHFDRLIEQVRADAIREWGELAISRLNAAYVEAPNQSLRDCASYALGLVKSGTGAR